MIKAPAKFKKPMSLAIKKYVTHIQNLIAKGKASTEEDARIIINDILAEVLGYDKYNDLKTEFKDKNGRLDYIVKLSEGPLAKKKDRFDFVIEAKAACVDLKEDHINQALTYCLSANIDYFLLTNAKEWKLFKVRKSKAKNEALLIWDVNLNAGETTEDLADQMYVLSKHAYIEEKWDFISDHSKATDMGDIMAIIYSDKFIKSICRSLKEIHEVKIVEETVKEVFNDNIFKDVNRMNKNLLKKLNTVEKKPTEATEECPPPISSIEPEKQSA